MKLALVDHPRAEPHHDALVYARAMAQTLLRLEQRGEVKPRLSEPGLRTWNTFRGRLGARHLLQILIEDAAVLYPIPFEARRIFLDQESPLSAISDRQVEAWAETAARGGAEEPAEEFLLECARELKLPTRMAKADIRVIHAHHKVLELPGTGGLLSHHVLLRNPGLRLEGAFHIACRTWQELTLAGIAAVDLKATGVLDAIRDLRKDPRLSSLRPTNGTNEGLWRYDFVLGLAPDKGGDYDEPTLRQWFPHAVVQLV